MTGFFSRLKQHFPPMSVLPPMPPPGHVRIDVPMVYNVQKPESEDVDDFLADLYLDEDGEERKEKIFLPSSFKVLSNGVDGIDQLIPLNRNDSEGHTIPFTTDDGYQAFVFLSDRSDGNPTGMRTVGILILSKTYKDEGNNVEYTAPVYIGIAGLKNVFLISSATCCEGEAYNLTRVHTNKGGHLSKETWSSVTGMQESVLSPTQGGKSVLAGQVLNDTWIEKIETADLQHFIQHISGQNHGADSNCNGLSATSFVDRTRAHVLGL